MKTMIFRNRFYIKKLIWFSQRRNNNKKNLLASLAHSPRALGAQLARMSELKGARPSGRRASLSDIFGLRAQCCALHSA